MKRILYTSLAVAACFVLTTAPVLAQRNAQASPLAKYPGFGHNAKADDEQFAKEEAARERKISRCMEREGFTYWPMPSIALEDFPSTRAAMAAARNNPNDRYVMLLSEEGRLRYYQALHGVDNPNALEAEQLRDPADPEASGCAAEAFRAIPGVFAAKSALTEEFNAMRQAVLMDQRVKAAEAQWSSCMQKQGFSFSSPRSIRQGLDQQIAQSLGNPEGLKKITEHHRSAQESSVVCAKAVRLQDAVAVVRNEYEAAFVKKHRQFLEDFLRTMRQQSLNDER